MKCEPLMAGKGDLHLVVFEKSYVQPLLICQLLPKKVSIESKMGRTSWRKFPDGWKRRCTL